MPRQLDLHEKVARLRQFIHEAKRLPTYREMLPLLGYRSKNAVHGFTNKLTEHGYLRRDSDGNFAPTTMLTGSTRILGSVQAGFPSPAEEELADLMSLDEYLVRRPENTFMLTVSGDSMIDAGIHAGDLVIVERGANARSGQIVVAQVDGEWTLKYYIKDRAGVRLEPANKDYKFIRPQRSLVIGGVVRGVVRRYA
jgi:SOS regulatory protein LexA